jgi:large subunit ribosomal protein L29
VKTKDIRNLTTEEINKKIVLDKEELLKLRMKQATGTLENPARIKELRREVARFKTIIRERELEEIKG